MTDVNGVPAAPAPAYTAPPAVNPGRTLGIVGLIVAFFVSILGLILSIVALVQSRKAGFKNTPAVWGIIVGAVFLVIGIIAVILVTTLGVAAVSSLCDGQAPGVYQLTGGGTITCK